MAKTTKAYQTAGVKLWSADTQPDILGKENSFADIEWTSSQIYENLYEPLRNKYPQWVRREFIGKDTSGECDMYAYEYTPKHWENTIYIQSGVHVIETEGYFGLARLMQLIAEPQNERFAWLRENVRFLIVPMVSVWGISHKGSYQQIMSEQRYEKCLQNVLGINSNRDFYDCRLSETVNVKNYVAKHADEIDAMFDFHTTTMPEWGAYLLPYPDNIGYCVATKLVQIDAMLYQKNCGSDVPIAYMGDESHYPTMPITSSFLAGFYKQYGVPGSTIEHSDYIFDSALGTSVCITRAVELYANHVFAAVGC